MRRVVEAHEIDWQGIALSVTVTDWGMTEVYGSPLMHLEIINADNKPHPISDTGYRSHFLPAAELAAQGGAVAFVLAWLSAAAPAWIAAQAATRQLSLF